MTAASEDECEEDESEEDHVKLVEEDSAESVAGQVRKRGSFGESHPRMVTEPCPSVLRFPHAAPGGSVCVASGHICGLVEGSLVKPNAFCLGGDRAAIRMLRLKCPSIYALPGRWAGTL